MYTHKIAPYERKNAVKANVCTCMCLLRYFFSLFGVRAHHMFRESENHSSAFSTNQPTKAHNPLNAIPPVGCTMTLLSAIQKIALNWVDSEFHSKYAQFFFSESVNNTRYDFLFTLFNCDFCGICRLLCVFVWCAFAPLEVSDDRFWTKSANGLRKLCHIFAIVILTFETRAKSLYPFLLKLLVVVPRNTWKKTNRTQMCKMT